MHGNTLNALLGYGFGTELVEKIGRHNLTVAYLRSASKSKLREDFSEEEVENIKAKIDRTPIPTDILDSILAKSLGCCCYCNDGNAVRPYQIHHVNPYSETQDNSEQNLMLVCPNHHVVIHNNGITRDEQRRTRWAWYAKVEISKEYTKRGLVFPFGAFEFVDFKAPAIPGELVEFAPLSPGTSLICYPGGLTEAPLATLRKSGFLLVMGASGSGKSTYSMALAGLQTNEGYSVFRYRYEKTGASSRAELAAFISLCVQKSVILLDDANRWATSDDLQWLAKTIANHGTVRVVATWTSDSSDDVARLVVSDLPKIHIAWEDLKPAVVDVLRRHESEVVAALQKYEGYSWGSLGMGVLNSSLEQRINSIGDKPQTVYEFVFCLRGDGVAVTEEFNRLFDDSRADIPVLVAAIEQIADFERPVSADEVVEAAKHAAGPPGLPSPTVSWVQAVFGRQIKERRIVLVRDHYTTIHRKWASKFIAAGLSRTAPDKTINDLVLKSFSFSAEHPERLLRMWSWLRSLKEARPFVRRWVDSLSEADWIELVRICAAKGLMEIGFLAREMHLLKDGPSWTLTVNAAFTANEATIAALAHSTTPNKLYWLKELANPVEHAAPELWTRILLSWDRRSVANLLLGLSAHQFDDAWGAFNKAMKHCPGWLPEVGGCVSWAELERILMSADPGDVESVCEVFGWMHAFGKKVKRSQLRVFGLALAKAFRGADLENLRIPISCGGFMILKFYFPEEARAALDSIDASKIGSHLATALPRDWRKLSMLGLWAEWCDSEIGKEILKNCDQDKLLGQIKRLGPSNPDELRPTFLFLARGAKGLGSGFAEELKDLVRMTCSGKDDMARSILGAYAELAPFSASELANELDVEPEVIKTRAEVETTEEMIAMRKHHRELDSLGQDYDLDLS